MNKKKLQLLQKELEATLRGLQQRRPDTRTQLGVLEEQIRTARGEKQRLENLVKANAATPKQLDDLNAQLAVLDRQLAANLVYAVKVAVKNDGYLKLGLYGNLTF